MKRIFSICFLSIFLLSLTASSGLSQTAEGILAKMIEAQGGRKTLEKIKDATISGSLEIIQQGMTLTLTIYSKEPNKMRMDMEVMGMVITQAFDGETAWGTNMQTFSIEEMPEDQAEDFKRQALGNDALLNPKKYGITYKYIGKEKIEDKDCFVLEQTFSDGFKATLYVDSKTYLTHKIKAKSISQMGVEVESDTYLSDYKKVEGMMYPHAMTVFQDGEESVTMTFTEISINSGLEDSLFKME